jgi:hypothetical protein
MWWLLSVIVSVAVVGSLTWWKCVFQKKEKKKPVFISASSVAAAVGMHPFKTSLDLYSELISGVRNDVESAATSHGMLNENKAFILYKTMYNSSVREGAGQMFFSRAMPWLRGYVDGLVWNNVGTKIEAVLEIKCRFVFGRWCESKIAHFVTFQRYSKTDDAVPYQRIEDMFYHIPQIQCYLEMTDSSYCDLMSYTRRGSTVFRVVRNRALFYLLQIALNRFRISVESKTPPVPDVALTEQIRDLCLNCEWTQAPQMFQMDDIFD